MCGVQVLQHIPVLLGRCFHPLNSAGWQTEGVGRPHLSVVHGEYHLYAVQQNDQLTPRPKQYTNCWLHCCGRWNQITTALGHYDS